MPVQKQKQQAGEAEILVQKSKRLLGRRLLILTVVLVIIIIAAILWIHYSGPTWYNILPAIILTGLGLLIALFQWIFPFTPHEPGTSSKQKTATSADSLEEHPLKDDSTIYLHNGGQKKDSKEPYHDPDAVFQFNSPLTNPDEFYGRINTRATLISRTRKGASTSIVGPRRIGKTW